MTRILPGCTKHTPVGVANPEVEMRKRLLEVLGVVGVVDLEHYENAPPCDGFKALIIVASADPAWSMAAIRRSFCWPTIGPR